jgi:HD-GYP domain-containing protein (c-di-GMP phosphodiesterase class II)
MGCDHAGGQSAVGRYLKDVHKLRLVMVCDECGMELGELDRIDYEPHARRFVAHLAELTAQEMGLTDGQVAKVRLAALICGLGRDQIRAEILNKVGPLDDEEWEEVRSEPEFGAALLSEASFVDIREWILAHRERPDGRGYPHGLFRGQIPIEARILAVSQAYAAMTAERPYRLTRNHREACQELWRCAGTQFDLGVVQAFLRASLHRNEHLARAAA